MESISNSFSFLSLSTSSSSSLSSSSEDLSVGVSLPQEILNIIISFCIPSTGLQLSNELEDSKILQNMRSLMLVSKKISTETKRLVYGKPLHVRAYHDRNIDLIYPLRLQRMLDSKVLARWAGMVIHILPREYLVNDGAKYLSGMWRGSGAGFDDLEEDEEGEHDENAQYRLVSTTFHDTLFESAPPRYIKHDLGMSDALSLHLRERVQDGTMSIKLSIEDKMEWHGEHLHGLPFWSISAITYLLAEWRWIDGRTYMFDIGATERRDNLVEVPRRLYHECVSVPLIGTMFETDEPVIRPLLTQESSEYTRTVRPAFKSHLWRIHKRSLREAWRGMPQLYTPDHGHWYDKWFMEDASIGDHCGVVIFGIQGLNSDLEGGWEKEAEDGEDVLDLGESENWVPNIDLHVVEVFRCPISGFGEDG